MNGEPVTGEPPEPITPWRAMCNRLILDAATRSYDRRHGRTSRRNASRTQDPSVTARGAAQAREEITKGAAA
jgi:hypothetical protein